MFYYAKYLMAGNLNHIFRINQMIKKKMQIQMDAPILNTQKQQTLDRPMCDREKRRIQAKRRYFEYRHAIQNEVVQCACGKYMCRNSINTHLKSKVHASYMAIKNNPVKPTLVIKHEIPSN
jgi:hypothetical protein